MRRVLPGCELSRNTRRSRFHGRSPRECPGFRGGGSLLAVRGGFVALAADLPAADVTLAVELVDGRYLAAAVGASPGCYRLDMFAGSADVALVVYDLVQV